MCVEILTAIRVALVRVHPLGAIERVAGVHELPMAGPRPRVQPELCPTCQVAAGELGSGAAREIVSSPLGVPWRGGNAARTVQSGGDEEGTKTGGA